ncbi:unnamed protein product [Clonostachys byssicola]|uniref:Nucleoside phosphorylase domain-containing protein n=1 Tax=Clonostachys byssicola TaxID=160290 RepID=A0A9N9Y316_9HYPO|nr:unnamed protein product [Clonostachys byssicola]
MGLNLDENFYNRVDSLLEVLEDMCLSKTNVKLMSREQPMKHRFPGLYMLVEDERRKEPNQDEARNGPNWQAERLSRKIFEYLKRPNDILDILEKRCKSLIDLFPKDGWERDFEDAESEDHSTAQTALFQTLAKYTPCGICKHQDAKDPASWHPTRLFLMRLESKEDLVRFDVITSSTIDGSWEDLCIEIPASTSRVRFANEKGPDRESRDLTGLDDAPIDSFCKIFQDNNGCRVSLRLHGKDLFWSRDEALRHEPSPGSGMSLSSVLSQFKLTVREKFALAYIIALSFWQFYSSELMHKVWSSDTIWFMPQADGQREPKKVPLKAYVSFHPDATKCDDDASECIKRRGLIHKYPRIQSLGILLLEIGLGEPLCPPSSDFENQRLNKRLNNRHMDALKKLEELENNKWDINSQYLEAFVRTIRNCLEFNNSAGMEDDLNTSNSHLSRREWLHQRVVAVLAYLDRLFPRIDNKPLGSALVSGSHGPVNMHAPVAAYINPEVDQASDRGSKHANSTQLRGPRSPTSGEDFEIAIICALTREAAAVEALFDHSWGSDDPRYRKSSGDKNAYSTGSFGRHNIVLIHMGRMGKVHAASVAANCQATFPNIKLAIVVGICGAVPLAPGRGEIVLGDVIVSEGIVQYDFGRQFTESFELKDTLLESLPRPNNQIANFLAKLRTPKVEATLHEKMSGYLSTLQQIPKLEACYPDTNLDILFDAKYEHRDKDLSCKDAGCCGQIVTRARFIDGTPEPEVHFGLFASGDKVMKSGAHRDALAKLEGILGFEMEGAGVWENFPSCVVIKSACDYADSHKTKAFQQYAAATAASCAKAFLDEWV